MGCINYANVHELKTFVTVNAMKIQIVAHYMNLMVKYHCKQCNKTVDSNTHSHAGNPLSPSDKTIGGKFWSSKT
ncbi:uncharacterized protein METZ01_LOCUS257585, partial [marine metagenome]